MFFTFTDRVSTVPSNIRGCQSDTWSAGRKKVRGTSTKFQVYVSLCLHLGHHPIIIWFCLSVRLVAVFRLLNLEATVRFLERKEPPSLSGKNRAAAIALTLIKGPAVSAETFLLRRLRCFLSLNCSSYMINKLQTVQLDILYDA